MTESVAAKNGDDVTLTIDRDVQWYVKKVLKEAESKYGAAWAIAVVQDVQSGEILALADSDEVQAGEDEPVSGRVRNLRAWFGGQGYLHVRLSADGTA